MNILAVDVGGTHVKVLVSGEAGKLMNEEAREFDSARRWTLVRGRPLCR